MRTLKCYLIFSLFCNFPASSSNEVRSSLPNRLYQSFGPDSEHFSGLLVSGIGIAGGIVGTAIALTQAVALYKHMKKVTPQDQAEYNQSKIKCIVCTIAGSLFCILGIASAIIFVDRFKNSYQEFKSTNTRTLETHQAEPFVLIPPPSTHAQPDIRQESALPSVQLLLLPITTPEATALIASLPQEAEAPENNSLPSTLEENFTAPVVTQRAASPPADITKILNALWIFKPEKPENNSLIRLTLKHATRAKSRKP
ncbi:MAG: hypothetical protein QG632_400 [Candidatus Dependentiae bacterium]|nr:hypothetical protein [Candidatus Dependentiae bacterium]